MSAKLLFRHAILLQLEAAAPASLPPATLVQGLALAGHGRQCRRLPQELQYLGDKGLIHACPSELSPGEMRYRLTAEGRDYLEREGLA